MQTCTLADAHRYADTLRRAVHADMMHGQRFAIFVNWLSVESVCTSLQMEETHSKPLASSGNAAWSAKSKANKAFKKAACTRLREGKAKARSRAAESSAESAERNTLGLSKRICLEPVPNIAAGGRLVGVVAPELGTLIAAAPEAFGEDCVCVRFNIVHVVVLAD